MEEVQESTTRNNSTKKFNPLILVAVLALVIVAGGITYKLHKHSSTTAVQGMQTMKAEPTQAQKPTEVMTQAATQSATDEQTINIEAGSFYYRPATITVKKGQKVKVVMNSVSMMHDFNIDELNVHMDKVKNGDTGTVEFIADKVGTFEYYCSVGHHRQMGQVGKITVE